jgi:hypothetical protein
VCPLQRTSKFLFFTPREPADYLLQVPAICLAIVQNYTLLSDPWRLQRRAERLDDVDGSPAEYEHLLLLKAACEVRQAGGKGGKLSGWLSVGGGSGEAGRGGPGDAAALAGGCGGSL